MCKSELSPLEVAAGLDSVEIPLSLLEDTVYSCGESLEALPLFVVRGACSLLVLFHLLTSFGVLLMLSSVFLEFNLVKEVVLFFVLLVLVLLFLQTFSYLVHIPLPAHVVPCKHHKHPTEVYSIGVLILL